MVKKLGAIASVDNIRPHYFRHDFGTSITRKGVDPLHGMDLMGIKSDRICGRYIQGKASGDLGLFAGDED